MTLLIWNLLLAFLWAAMIEDFSIGSLAIGFALGFAVLFIARSLFREEGYFRDLAELVGLAGFFVLELVLANIRMAYFVIMPLNRIRPGVIAIPLESMTDTELTVLANLITLTPGTLSVDAWRDPQSGRRVLYVHVMSYRDADEVRNSIKRGFERRVLGALR